MKKIYALSLLMPILAGCLAPANSETTTSSGISLPLATSAGSGC